MSQWILLPPRPELCQKCAVLHDVRDPHNQQSLYWQYWFHLQHGRWPTWADAMAHCSPEIQSLWKAELAKEGVMV